MKTIKRIELKVYRDKLAEGRAPYNVRIEGPEDVYKIASSLLDGCDHEKFLAMPVDVKNKVLGYVEVAKGSVDICPVDPREIFRAAIVMGASALILVHNHPSGDLETSAEDVELTQRAVAAGKLLNIPILDHVIVTDSGFTSLNGLGLMES